MDRQHFAGKTVWIVGASAGIGAALARELAGRGATLILSARSRAALEELAADCGAATVLPLDLAEPGAVQAAVDTLGKQRKLDAVVCTAALYDPSRVSEIDMKAAEDLVRVNLLGTLELARLAPSLLSDGGQLVLFGSVAGYFGLPNGQLYSATKAAIINLAESLRVELAPQVDVRLVCPGFVRTRLTDKNDFDMPAIIEAEQAAVLIADGLAGRSFEIHFPKRFTLMLKLLSALPYWLAFRLTARLN